MPVDPERVAFGFNTGERCTVHIVTREKAEYSFPDMSLAELKKVLPEPGRILASMPSLMMVNASGSVLSIPFRIITNISVESEELWACPA